MRNTAWPGTSDSSNTSKESTRLPTICPAICTPAAHLYAAWGRHPLRGNIATIQTRLLPERVGELRRKLPDTYLQLTFHPQHFDVAGVESEEVRWALRKAALDVEYRDVSFVVFAIAHDIEDVARLDTNLQAFYDALAEINAAGH